MSLFLQTVCRLLTVICMTIFFHQSVARAQDLAPVELVSIDRDAGTARVRVRAGASVRDLNGLVRRHALEPGVHADMERISELNPGRIITVCFDQLPGERPFMSRSSDAWNACQHFPRSRWLVAGVTYVVPLRATREFPSTPIASPLPPDETPSFPAAVPPEDSGGSAREADRLRASLDAAQRSEREAIVASSISQRQYREMEARFERTTRDKLFFALIALVLAIGMLYLLHRLQRLRTRLMHVLRRERVRWSDFAEDTRLTHQKAIDELKLTHQAAKDAYAIEVTQLKDKIAMLSRGVDERSEAFSGVRTQHGRLRRRTNLLLVQLAKYRKLLRQSTNRVSYFHRRFTEDQHRRQQLSEFLYLAIQTQRQHKDVLDREHRLYERERELVNLERDTAQFLQQLLQREQDHQKQVELSSQLTSNQTEASAQLSDVERRMAEMEGRMSGFESRAAIAERELSETNDFLEKVRMEFRLAKELIEGIKKGPQFLEARTIQMAEYIHQLELQLGITRKSIWSGLPEVSYTVSTKPKA